MVGKRLFPSVTRLALLTSSWLDLFLALKHLQHIISSKPVLSGGGWLYVYWAFFLDIFSFTSKTTKSNNFYIHFSPFLLFQLLLVLFSYPSLSSSSPFSSASSSLPHSFPSLSSSSSTSFPTLFPLLYHHHHHHFSLFIIFSYFFFLLPAASKTKLTQPMIQYRTCCFSGCDCHGR